MYRGEKCKRTSGITKLHDLRFSLISKNFDEFLINFGNSNHLLNS